MRGEMEEMILQPDETRAPPSKTQLCAANPFDPLPLNGQISRIAQSRIPPMIARHDGIHPHHLHKCHLRGSGGAP